MQWKKTFPILISHHQNGWWMRSAGSSNILTYKITICKLYKNFQLTKNWKSKILFTEPTLYPVCGQRGSTESCFDDFEGIQDLDHMHYFYTVGLLEEFLNKVC